MPHVYFYLAKNPSYTVIIMNSFLNSTKQKNQIPNPKYSEWESVAYKQCKHNLTHKVILVTKDV